MPSKVRSKARSKKLDLKRLEAMQQFADRTAALLSHTGRTVSGFQIMLFMALKGVK